MVWFSLSLFALGGWCVSATGSAAPFEADSTVPVWCAHDSDRGLRAEVTSAGVRVFGMEEGDEARALGLQLVRWGRGDSLEAPGSARERVTASRAERDYGSLVEWYVHDERGLEHGFTIEAAPASEGDGPAETVRLVLALAGVFDTRSASDGRSVHFASSSGGVDITYGGLRAWDATGRGLDARLDVAACEVTITVDDHGASYPLTVDPWIWIRQGRLTTLDDGRYQGFGTSVSVEDDMALVGANQADGADVGSGAAYVFSRGGSDWSPLSRFHAADGEAGDGFGGAVALQGNTALVGAPYDEDHGYQSGSAYVFVRSGATWYEEAKITPADGTPYALFGSSLAIEGETAFIGAPHERGQGMFTGAVYVLVRSGSTWTQQAKLTASDGEAYDWFGRSVSVAGDTLMVGALGGDGLVADSGAVYVFQRSGTVWSEQAMIVALDGSTGDGFGNSVSFDGDRVLVGADYYDQGFATGTAYVFARAGTGWVQQAQLHAGDAGANAHFGFSVSLDGDAALVGAYGDDEFGRHAGAAYVFHGSGPVWQQATKLTSPRPWMNEIFGRQVALDRGTAMVAAHLDMSVTPPEMGAVHVFARRASASATFRTDAGATNASHFATADPILGLSWLSFVDNAPTGNTAAGVVGFANPLELYLPRYDDWLLVDPTSPGGELLGLPLRTGTGSLDFVYFMPSDVAFAGFTFSAQAFSVGGAGGVNLQNAYDLFVGF